MRLVTAKDGLDGVGDIGSDDFHISIARTMNPGSLVALSGGAYNYPVMLNQAHAGRLSVTATDCIDPGVILTHRLDPIYKSNCIHGRPSWSFKKRGPDHAREGKSLASGIGTRSVGYVHAVIRETERCTARLAIRALHTCLG